MHPEEHSLLYANTPPALPLSLSLSLSLSFSLSPSLSLAHSLSFTSHPRSFPLPPPTFFSLCLFFAASSLSLLCLLLSSSLSSLRFGAGSSQHRVTHRQLLTRDTLLSL